MSATLFDMKTTTMPAAYRRLQARMGRIGWVALGSVVERTGSGRGGPRYQWTRRLDGKTVTVALSAEQFEWIKTALANQREAWALLEQMQRLSLGHMWKYVPSTSRRKRLTRKHMGTI
jgi:hypothetical protein